MKRLLANRVYDAKGALVATLLGNYNDDWVLGAMNLTLLGSFYHSLASPFGASRGQESTTSVARTMNAAMMRDIYKAEGL